MISIAMKKSLLVVVVMLKSAYLASVELSCNPLGFDEKLHVELT